jgi:hypothetical protein
MKIKTDFVTNSSSTSYILSILENELPKLVTIVETLHQDELASNEGCHVRNIFRTKQELQDYTNGAPYDWVSKCRGFRYWNLDEREYDLFEKAISEGNLGVYVYIDRNVDATFERQFLKHFTEKQMLDSIN